MEEINEQGGEQQVDTGKMFKNMVGASSPLALLPTLAPLAPLAPLAMPIVHGISGIAILGLGAVAIGTTAFKTISALSRHPKPGDIENDPFL